MFSKSVHKIIQHSGENSFTDNPRLISIAIKHPDIHFRNLFGSLRNKTDNYFYSTKPEEKLAFLGYNSLLSIEESGDNRLAKTGERVAVLQSNWQNNFSDFGLKSIPLILGGMKFSSGDTADLWEDFSDSDWFVPKFLFIRSNHASFIVINFLNQSFTEKQLKRHYEQALELLNADASHQEYPKQNEIVYSNIWDESEKSNWVKRVNNALNQISGNEFQKIVLSRQVEIKLAEEINIYDTLTRLEENYPRCYIFAYRKNKSIFFGASPEMLARIKDGWVEADALAGSIQRGATKAEDERLETELLQSKKNISEQKAVVDFITNSFSQFSDEIVFNENPIIRKLPNIQHLWTPIKARLKGNDNIFTILKDIHPTPAICGVPWSNALVSIKKMENHSRGLFAGMIGWFNFENEGEFAVAIRSALARNDKVYAFAGCGIVEGSDPEQEYNEAELKLKPILGLFKNEKIYQS